MYEAVAYHFIFALEAFTAFGAWTAGDWAIVRSILRVHVCVRASRLISKFVWILLLLEVCNNSLQQILRLERKRIASRIVASERSHTVLSQLLYARAIRRR
jgi:hypothetical protein